MELGEMIPEFTLKDQDGNEVNIRSHIGKGPIIIFFYPKNFTRGCTKQVCGFRDNYNKIRENDAIIYGISSDGISSHKAFRLKYDLPFDLLSDKGGAVRKKFGVSNEIFGLVPGRTTFVFDKEGKLRMKYNSLFGAEDHVSNSLDALDSL